MALVGVQKHLLLLRDDVAADRGQRRRALTWKRTPAGITPSARSRAKTRYDSR